MPVAWSRPLWPELRAICQARIFVGLSWGLLPCLFWCYRRHELAGGGWDRTGLEPEPPAVADPSKMILIPGKDGSRISVVKLDVGESHVGVWQGVSGYYCRKFHRQHHLYVRNHNGLGTKVHCVCCGRKWRRTLNIRPHGLFCSVVDDNALF